MATGIVAASLLYAGLVKNLPSLDVLPDLLNPDQGLLMQPTRLYDRSGQKLLRSLENPGISRRYLYLDTTRADHFSPELARVAVGYFDPAFWNSPGVSPQHFFDPNPQTIAEWLVNDLLLWEEPAGPGKTARMRLLAAQVIARYGHAQVLEWFLNSANFGHLAYGADSAAQLYLGKSAASVDLAQAALLAAALKAPGLNPLDAPELALAGEQEVLRLLLKQKVIDKEEYLRASTAEIAIAQAPVEPQIPAKAFSRLVVERLERSISLERLERGGFRVITTLDYDLQMELSCLAQTQISRLASQPGEQPDETRLFNGNACQSVRLLPTLPPGSQPVTETLSANAVVIDPLTGQVLALLGDTTLQGEIEQFSSHAPGSLLTPFVAVASFARGMGPASLVWDIPSSLPENLASIPDPDGTFHGPVRMRLALANDYLAPQARLVEQLGAAAVWKLAGAMGLSSLENEKSNGLIYAGGQTTLLEIAHAYSVFATQGFLAGERLSSRNNLQPSLVLYVEDARGTGLLDFHAHETQSVTTPQLAYLVHHILSDESARWPSLGSPNSLEIGRPSGAKIGRVEGNRQVWVAGYTPRRVAVFWLGFPGEGTQQVSPMMAGGMWHALMQYANRGLPVEDWQKPPGITTLDVCNPSGLLPTAACPETVREIFLSGSEPNVPDNLYQKVQINRETGRLATVFTPAELIEEKTFLVVPYEAKSWAQAAGLPVPPTEYDAIQLSEPSAEVKISSPQLYSFLHGQVAIKGTAAGNGFDFYQLLVGQGVNPQTWLQIGEDGVSPVNEGVLGVWDTENLEGLYTIRLLVVRKDQTLETATIQVTVDNQAPLVRIPYPQAGQVFNQAAGETITFQAAASDAFGVARVVWLVDGIVVGESTSNPYIFTWNARQGEHQMQVRTYDQAGNVGESEIVHFQVVPKQP